MPHQFPAAQASQVPLLPQTTLILTMFQACFDIPCDGILLDPIAKPGPSADLLMEVLDEGEEENNEADQWIPEDDLQFRPNEALFEDDNSATLSEDGDEALLPSALSEHPSLLNAYVNVFLSVAYKGATHSVAQDMLTMTYLTIKSCFPGGVPPEMILTTWRGHYTLLKGDLVLTLTGLLPITSSAQPAGRCTILQNSRPSPQYSALLPSLKTQYFTQNEPPLVA
ncbi:hypothetical protein PAXRUDRAFT_29227 [Paxillus rubicundulus Ve08.2h10]|uniref:Unplaced genomic scaffold scaffold_4640, whole genome shotgun sequence n=1 Tax=Paxillus rubicundulus Ve08.2h10 TaxID=930991 RepID=A0A0D0BQD0_9AGAM|nr:hypothetical protein PAXRUDRAFT_29227 [Paxillus rubicundulus Ve08.2h10]